MPHKILAVLAALLAIGCNYKKKTDIPQERGRKDPRRAMVAEHGRSHP